MRDSKITFRVSDEMLETVDSIDESRSEVMREALREYLESGGSGGGSRAQAERMTGTKKRATLDGVIRGMVREAVEDAVDERLRARERENVNVTVNVPEGHGTRPEEHGDERMTEPAPGESPRRRTTDDDGSKTCHQCGEEIAEDHVHCPNCGAKASQRLFCDCGDEIRSDWSFCPSCGRRTPASHALGKE